MLWWDLQSIRHGILSYSARYLGLELCRRSKHLGFGKKVHRYYYAGLRFKTLRDAKRAAKAVREIHDGLS